MERYFKNPYPDYNRNEQVFTNINLWDEYIKKTSVACFNHLKPKSSSKYCDGGLYTGNLGLIFMAYKLIKNKRFAEYEPQILNYVRECLKASEEFYLNSIPSNRDVSFLVGKGGFLVMGCIGSRLLGEDSNTLLYSKSYADLAPICEPIEFLKHGSDELFVGRAGYLCGLLVLKKYLNIEPLAKHEIFKICHSIIKSGRMYSIAFDSPCPLMYAYHKTEYLGCAHGLAGVLLILLCYPEYLNDNLEAEKYVKDSVDFLLSIRKPNKNFPSSMNEENPSMPRHESKDLVHWCHGATGVIFLLAKAYLYWKDKKYLDACIECGDLIWHKGLIRKGPGICHGIAGSGYAHLLLFRLTNDFKYLYRANKFAEFLDTDEFKIEARTPDSPFSLFEGLAGTVCFIIDLIDPKNAEYPLIPIF